MTKTGNGVSSLGAAPYATAQVAAGVTTQVVYIADEWHRVFSLATNGVAVPAADGSKVFTQVIANVSGNISNAVGFALATPAQTSYTNVPTSWLTNWTEAAVQAGGGDAFNMDTKYLLGLDPTSSNTYQLTVDSLAVVGSNVVLVIKRDVTGALSPDGMHGYLTLQGAGKLGEAFTNLSGTAVTGTTVFDGSGHRRYTNAVDGAARFYKVVIE